MFLRKFFCKNFQIPDGPHWAFCSENSLFPITLASPSRCYRPEDDNRS